MSLQVWLPLTKDLRQQGLDNITVTTANTNNFQNEGKLSSKSLDVSGHYAFRVPSLVKKRVFSCAFWYKPITDSSLSDNWRRIIVFDTYTSDGSTTGAIFRFESSYGYQSSNTTYCISIHNNAGEPIASIGTGLGETNGWNKWQHIAITADGTTLKCYRNGVQVASGNMGNGGMLQGTVHIGYNGNRPVGRLNDFRLYDHCLSPMEVKELAKGLVLHYPLNRQGWGQENLVVNTSPILRSGSIAQYYTELGHNSTDFFGLTTGDIATFRVYLKAPAEKKVKARIQFYTDGNNRISINGNWINAGDEGYSTITWTLTAAQRAYSQMQLLCDCNDGTTTTDIFYWKEVKLEKGSIATPWCPNSSDALATTMGLNSTTEYDCSGFCNNGTRTGTFTWISDTPKYNVSQVFASGNNYIDCGASQVILPTDGLTVSLWTNYSTWGNPISCTEGGGWNFENSSGIQFPVYVAGVGYKVANSGVATSTLQNGWHMLTGTFDKTNVKIYIDGILKATTATGSTNGIGYAANHCYIGAEAAGSTSIASAALVGKLSDVRIYATALSADDVKSLYQNSAYIDGSGNVYGAVHTEV